MAIIRHMLNLLDAAMSCSPEMQEEFAKKLEEVAKVKLAKQDKKKSFKNRLKRSRFGRPGTALDLLLKLITLGLEYLRILTTYREWFPVIERQKWDEESRKSIQGIKIAWEKFYPLCVLATQEKVASTLTESAWISMAKEFGIALVTARGPKAITTYVHVFIYHVGFFLEKYGSIEMFANYGIEGLVRKLKKILANSTNGFSLVGKKGRKSATYQQLATLCRIKLGALPLWMQEAAKKSRQNWTTVQLTELPIEYRQYVHAC
jgi:hypothetical protein